MGNPSDIITVPKGGGALQAIGEKFSPDLFTGTGNFTVPIALPPGRNGFKPQVDLVYSTGNGNGPFGLGWNLSIPGIARKTSKGVPRYDSSDAFVLSGAEDLVPVGSPSPDVTQYRPRTEGLFARILHHQSSGATTDMWEVRSKDGLTSWYGGVAAPGDEAALVRNEAMGRIFAWRLTSTTDPFGNRIEYSYARDPVRTDGPHQWDQIYLSEIRYADHGAPGSGEFMVRVKFAYDPPFIPSSPLATRPDPFSDYRAGFEIRTIRRCKRIEIYTYPGDEVLTRAYDLIYRDEIAGLDDNAPSLLSRIRVEGHDGANSESWPPLDLSYTEFKPESQKFMSVTGTVPASSLAEKSLALVDLFGSGMPDILQMNGSVRYWRNQGQGRFAPPQDMDEAPAGFGLADVGVQILDANGDGTADLLVSTQGLAGYFPMRFSGLWDSHSFQPYTSAPSFDLKDPQVRMVDLDGDGVTDAIRSSTSLECYFNDSQLGWITTSRSERKPLDVFPNVDFADPRVKWADMTGGGFQSVVLVHDGLIEYWPALGRGSWAKRIEMPGPRFPWGYDPKRILLGDVNGDGAADLVYVDNAQVTLWVNESGNSWSAPIIIEGTPPVSDLDLVELVDLLGNGIVGVLWSKDATAMSNANAYFLDLTGGVKPYLLEYVNNNLGAVTRVTYRPSTYYYLQDQQRPETRWISPLPFPVQVVASVQTTDQFSGGTLTTEYSYHHGYWDGYEREFRGFGRVDHRDSEVFSASPSVPPQYFSPPTETRTWFHQGAIGDRFSGWQESDAYDGPKSYVSEYFREPWPARAATAQVLERPDAMATFLAGLHTAVRRDALRGMRGSVLRTELYALDGSLRQHRPYTVMEQVHGVQEVARDDSSLSPLHVFFPCSLSQRTTQWERGDDPLSVFVFTDACLSMQTGVQISDYDSYGQLRSQIRIAVPRGRDFQTAGSPGEPYLVTYVTTEYVQRDDAQVYMVNRESSKTTRAVANDASMKLIDLVRQIQGTTASGDIIDHTLSFYDPDPSGAHQFIYGAHVRTESLIFTDSMLAEIYQGRLPPYLTSGPPNWTSEYPLEFRRLLPPAAGYGYHSAAPGSAYQTGYYRILLDQTYDFQQSPPPSKRGLLVVTRDALGNETVITYDTYDLLPITVTQVIPGGVGSAAGLSTQASYDYRVFQPSIVTGPNGNQTIYAVTPLGLLASIWVAGKAGEGVGDPPSAPSTQLVYTFMGTDSSGLPVPIVDLGQPVSVRTIRRTHHATETDVPPPDRDQIIETTEFTDGFGRLLQTRIQAEDVIFDSASPGNPVFGDAGLPADQSQPAGDAVGQQATPGDPFVVVSGWQIYDNKGRVVEQYEPFFSSGWGYAKPGDLQTGQQSILYYDPHGHVVRTVNPDHSERRVVYGVPGTIATPDLTNPDVFEPTPWEAYTYDSNDNAGRTHPSSSGGYQQCWDTPGSILIDCLGRTVMAVERNRDQLADGSWSSAVEYTTLATHDVVGNLLGVTDTLGRAPFTYRYDLAGQALRTQSIDAGTRLIVLDASGTPTEQRDAKGALLLHAYDAIHRPIRLWARDASGQAVTLREQIIYGDDSANSGLTYSEAMAANILAKPYKHYDEAGLLTFSSYDFKGNVLDKLRNVFMESALLAPFNPPPPGWAVTPFRVDWSATDLSFLNVNASYQTTLSYDALNRVKTMQYSLDVGGSRKLLVPRYNRAGALESMQMDGSTYVERIAYNAKGQRILISHGNALMTRYAYDFRTFRLLRLRTEKYSQLIGTVTYHPSALAKPLQDFGYEYDLVGNILALHDRTPGSGIRKSKLGVDALDRNFVYDPIYRLISATGRECDVPPRRPPWDARARCADIKKVRPYAETYQYDNLGNSTLINHVYVDLSGHTFNINRSFTLTPGDVNNQLSKLTVGPDSYQYAYDLTGNLATENTERHLEWDAADRLRVFRIQPAGAPPSIYAQHLYDSSGQRVMKLVRDQGGGYETTIYIDGAFEHQRSVRGGRTVENNSLHVMDNQQRVATVRVGPALLGDGARNIPIKYLFSDHLGSSAVVVDDAGAWINREEYSPYGETTFGSFARKRYRFTAKERDAESGLYYYGARYYACWLTRWISCDPVGMADGLNSYAYVRGNPINLRDQHGMQSTSDSGAAIEVEGHLQIKADSPKFTPSNIVVSEKVFQLLNEVFGETGDTGLRFQKQEQMIFSEVNVKTGEEKTQVLEGYGFLEIDLNKPHPNNPNWDALKTVVESRQIVLMIAPEDYGTHRRFDSKRDAGSIEPDWDIIRGVGETLPAQELEKGTAVKSPFQKYSILYMMQGEYDSKTVAHELFGHFALLIEGKPWRHEEPDAGVVDGGVSDYIQKQVEDKLPAPVKGFEYRLNQQGIKETGRDMYRTRNLRARPIPAPPLR